MRFNKHLFISYAHIDNMATPDDNQGWVSRFHSSLKAFLSGAIGEEAVIWRDDKLRGNDVFADEIVDQFPETALLVSIVSPRYLMSEWCLKEIHEYCRVAEQHGGLVIDNKMRVHKVMLKPIAAEPLEKLPGILKHGLGYLFYEEEEGGRFLTLDPRFGDKFKAAFNREIALMADDLAAVIEKLKSEANPVAVDPVGPPKPVIYLAECSWDRGDDREKIRSELRATGYTVLPDQGTCLPEPEQEYAAAVDRLLDGCQLSVHVIGANTGKVLNGPGRKEAVQLQNELASKKSGIPRLVWLPTAISGQPEQQAFIDALRSKAELQRGGDLIEGNLEALKTALRMAPKKLEEPSPKAEATGNTGPPMIYLICVARDRPATVPLRKFLKGQGLNVQLPVFEGDAATVRRANDELLARCDGLVVFYGLGDEAWKRMTESNLQKAKASRIGRPLLANTTYLAPPSTGHKQDCIDMGEENLVNGLEMFSEAALAPLVATVKGRDR